jgi:hypothetical protein
MIHSFFSSWTIADWVNTSLSLLLFVAGGWVTKFLGAKQEQNLKEI